MVTTRPVRIGVVVFPGSNCDADAYHALTTFPGVDPEYLWHKDADLKDVEAVVLPGGFSYGDYLRCGAIARFSPIMRTVTDFAEGGGLVLGICNGFQILTEAGLLPGALISNANLQFICENVHLRVANTRTQFTSAFKNGEVITMPIAHHDGNYTADEDTLKELEDEGQIVFQYSDAAGRVTDAANPNGSRRNIAGVVNRGRNVLGMMPHPERAVDPLLGSTDGLALFESILSAVRA